MKLCQYIGIKMHKLMFQAHKKEAVPFRTASSFQTFSKLLKQTYVVWLLNLIFVSNCIFPVSPHCNRSIVTIITIVLTENTLVVSSDS